MTPRGWGSDGAGADHGQEGGDLNMAKRTRETSTLVALVDKVLQHPRINMLLVGMVLALLLVVYIQATK
jgi:hypothetical protein